MEQVKRNTKSGGSVGEKISSHYFALWQGAVHYDLLQAGYYCYLSPLYSCLHSVCQELLFFFFTNNLLSKYFFDQLLAKDSCLAQNIDLK